MLLCMFLHGSSIATWAEHDHTGPDASRLARLAEQRRAWVESLDFHTQVDTAGDHSQKRKDQQHRKDVGPGFLFGHRARDASWG